MPEVIDRAMQVAGEADVFVAVGTTLQVYPVAGAVDIARSAGAKVIIVNAEPTPTTTMSPTPCFPARSARSFRQSGSGAR